MQQTTSAYTAMKDYRAAYRTTADLKKQHDLLVAQQTELLPQIARAEATENKAREAMLLIIQNNDPANKNK